MLKYTVFGSIVIHVGQITNFQHNCILVLVCWGKSSDAIEKSFYFEQKSLKDDSRAGHYIRQTLRTHLIDSVPNCYTNHVVLFSGSEIPMACAYALYTRI